MSYSRWSDSHWYAFYNENGKLSLWYNMDHIIDWEYDELIEIMDQNPKLIPSYFMELYSCTLEEAEEAMVYIEQFIKDYDPSIGIDYNNEVHELLQKWKEND